MTEVDIFRPEEVSSWADVGEDGVLQTRLMVGQMVGARASGATVKARKLLLPIHRILVALIAKFLSFDFIFIVLYSV